MTKIVHQYNAPGFANLIEWADKHNTILRVRHPFRRETWQHVFVTSMVPMEYYDKDVSLYVSYSRRNQFCYVTVVDQITGQILADMTIKLF